MLKRAQWTILESDLFLWGKVLLDQRKPYWIWSTWIDAVVLEYAYFLDTDICEWRNSIDCVNEDKFTFYIRRSEKIYLLSHSSLCVFPCSDFFSFWIPSSHVTIYKYCFKWTLSLYFPSYSTVILYINISIYMRILLLFTQFAIINFIICFQQAKCDVRLLLKCKHTDVRGCYDVVC